MALAYTVRDRLLHNWVETLRAMDDHVKVVSYLSAEFLLGPQLGNNLLNPGIMEQVRKAVARHGPSLRGVVGPRGGARTGQRRLGSPGCLLPGLPGHPGSAHHRLWHSLRVRHFRPGDPVRLAGGGHRQVAGNGPWEICRPEIAHRVGWKGYTETYTDEFGHQRVRWGPRRGGAGTGGLHPEVSPMIPLGAGPPGADTHTGRKASAPPGSLP
jgi:starch phosphorylase